MFKKLEQLGGIKWLSVLAGAGLNLLLTMTLSVLGTRLLAVQPVFYERYGFALQILAIFVYTALIGYSTARAADANALKSAIYTSVGAVLPLLYLVAALQNIALLMLVVVALAGAYNGGAMGSRRNRSAS